MSTTPHHAGSLSHSGSRRHSRRSTGGSINFAQMSISPLTSTDITEHHFTSKRPKTPTRTRSYHHKSSSYLQGLSAPPTPGILTPSTYIPISSGSHGHHNHHNNNNNNGSIPRSKSSTHLHRKTASSDWLARTGLALTFDARENKGQSWLTTRDSSTSLNLDSSDSEKEGGDDDGVMVGAEEEEDDEDVFEDARSVRSFRSTRSGKSGKSGKGVVGGGTTPMWGRLSAEDEREVGVAKWVEKGHWDEVGDEVEEESDDEEEFTKRQAFKVGQFIDRWIGWRVFGQDDGESDDDEEEEGKEKEGRKKRVQLTEVKKERVPLSEEELRRVREKREEGVEEWKDPAWVLGVISNLVF